MGEDRNGRGRGESEGGGKVTTYNRLVAAFEDVSLNAQQVHYRAMSMEATADPSDVLTLIADLAAVVKYLADTAALAERER